MNKIGQVIEKVAYIGTICAIAFSLSSCNTEKINKYDSKVQEKYAQEIALDDTYNVNKIKTTAVDDLNRISDLEKKIRDKYSKQLYSEDGFFIEDIKLSNADNNGNVYYTFNSGPNKWDSGSTTYGVTINNNKICSRLEIVEKKL